MDTVGDTDVDEDVEVDVSTTRSSRRMINPCLPSKAEVEAHELTHLPYRNWCRHCVAARGRELSHHAHDKDHAVPEVHGLLLPR